MIKCDSLDFINHIYTTKAVLILQENKMNLISKNNSMLRNVFKSILFIVVVSIFISCQPKKTTRIAILHTNDMHGSLKNFDKLYFLKDSLLNIYDTVYLLSAGDMFSGNPYVDYHAERGYPIVDLMNKLKYSAAALGNHEFDYGQTVLEKRISQADFPILAANIVSDDLHLMSLSGEQYLKYNDITIQLISLIETENNGKPSSHPKNLDGINFIDPHVKASELLTDINTEHTLIGLTHLGFFDDSTLALNQPEFDVIIGGHSHTKIKDSKWVNNVLITQAGDYLKYVGLIELEYRGDKLQEKNYRLIDFNSLPEQNNYITELISEYEQSEYLDEELAVATTSLKNRNELGCFYTDAQLHSLGVDFAFQNYWGIRVDSLTAGIITRKDILKLDPFNNELVLYNMNIDELKSLIGSGYSTSYKFDLFIAGGTYALETDANDSLLAVHIYNYSGKPISPNKTYKVALNSYIASSYNLSCTDTGRHTNTITSDNIMKYLTEMKTIDYSGCNRVSIVKSK